MKIFFLVCKSLLISFCFLTLSLSAQDNERMNTLRLKGGGLTGNVKNDLENRTTNADFFNQEYNLGWNRTSGNTGVNNLGFDYFHSISNTVISNVFFGMNLNNYQRGYDWNSLYNSGYGFKSATNQIGYVDSSVGVTIPLSTTIRILPKYVVRSFRENFQGNYFGIGSPTTIGDQTIKASSTSGMVGAGLEIDLSPSITLFGEYLSLGHSALGNSGSYKNDMYQFSSGGLEITYVDGNYMTVAERAIAGVAIGIAPGLRLYIAAETDKMTTKSGSITAFVFDAGGINTFRSIGQYFASQKKEEIFISGIKFGLTLDLGI